MATKPRQDLIERCDSKKLGNVKLLGFIAGKVSDKRMGAIGDCAAWLHLVADRSMENKKVLYANFCNSRFCPFCAWRKACKDAMRLAVILDYVRYVLKKDVVFLTLTAPNVQDEDLESTIKMFNDSFKKLLKRREVLPVVKGFIRKLEVTRNEERGDNHPHFHCVLAVNKSYFNDRTYISHDEWLRLWQEVTGDYSITQVDVRKFRGSDVRELAKYTAKDADYLYSQEVFDAFYKAIKGKQVVTYGGVFADVNKLYKDKAPELDKVKELLTDDVDYAYRLFYRWGVESYGLVSMNELTEDEKRDIVKQACEDVEGDFDIMDSPVIKRGLINM